MRLTGKGNEVDGCASEGRRGTVEDDPDLATSILAELGKDVDEFSVVPHEDAILKSEGSGDRADSGVDPELLVEGTRVGRDELAAANERAGVEAEGCSQGAVSGVDGASSTDESVATGKLAPLNGSALHNGTVNGHDTEDELVGRKRGGGNR